MTFEDFIDTAETPLEEEAARIIAHNAEGYTGDGLAADIMAWCEDLADHGCESGMVGELIYYSDTCAFYERHAREIGEMLGVLCEITETQPADLFRGWCEDDPLALDTQNQNLLAWYSFVEKALLLCERAEEAGIFEEESNND